MAQGAVKNQNHPKSRCFLERKLPKGNISWCPHLKISIKRRKKFSRNTRNLYSPNCFAFSVNVKKDLCVFFLVAVLFKTAYLIYIFFLPLSSERTKNKTQFPVTNAVSKPLMKATFLEDRFPRTGLVSVFHKHGVFVSPLRDRVKEGTPCL